MGLVAGITGKASGMICRGNLRKALGLRGVLLMTTGAEDGRVKLGRLDGGIIRVRGLRSVARFAIHMRVLAGAFLVEDVRMAGFASLVAGEFNWPGRNFGYGISAVVAVPSEAFRDEKTSDDQEYQDAENEHPGQAE